MFKNSIIKVVFFWLSKQLKGMIVQILILWMIIMPQRDLKIKIALRGQTTFFTV